VIYFEFSVFRDGIREDFIHVDFMSVELELSRVFIRYTI
jgi:hypothetical protein